MPELQVYNTWGSSETGGAIFCDVTEVVKDPVKVASLGRPLAGKVEVRIMDPDGNTIQSDVNNPDRMAIKGDMAYMDDEGNVYMLGRADYIINVGGEKVSPVEVENIAGQYEFVKECACVSCNVANGVL